MINTFKNLKKTEQIQIIKDQISKQKQMKNELTKLNHDIINLIIESNLEEQLKTILIEDLSLDTNNLTNEKTR